MAIFKGQNIRLFLGGKCVAASTSSTLHIATKTEDASTKDSTDENGVTWDEIDVISAGWDASVDALILAHESEEILSKNSMSSKEIGGYTMYINNEASVFVKKGQRVTFITQDESYLHIVDLASTSILTSSAGSKTISFEATDRDYSVTVGMLTAPTADIVAIVTDAAIQLDDLLKFGKEVISTEFNETTGTKNRDKKSNIVSGESILTDLKLNANNREKATFTAQLTGVGKIS